ANTVVTAGQAFGDHRPRTLAVAKPLLLLRDLLVALLGIDEGSLGADLDCRLRRQGQVVGGVGQQVASA
ncbi:hypothetical protein B1218_37825, partial [Pseudomonas ogarae]